MKKCLTIFPGLAFVVSLWYLLAEAQFPKIVLIFKIQAFQVPIHQHLQFHTLWLNVFQVRVKIFNREHVVRKRSRE